MELFNSLIHSAERNIQNTHVVLANVVIFNVSKSSQEA